MWIIAQGADIKTVHRLLHHVHLTEINSLDLQKTLSDLNLPRSNPILNLTLGLAASQKRLTRQQHNPAAFSVINNNVLTNSRGMELALINIGGFRSFAGITNEITYYLPSIKKWRHLTSIPHVEQCNYGTAVLRNELYVVGGCYNVCLKEYIHPFGFRYNPLTNKWTTINPMKQDRCRFSLNFVSNYLYAVGGAREIDDSDELWSQEPDEHESNSERYDPDTESWEYIAAIPENRTQHAGAGYNMNLYISGGLDRHRVLSTFWRYDPNGDTWESLPEMISARADHVMLVIENKLYVCGGWCEESLTDNRRLVETIDVYDPELHTWDTVTVIPTPKYHAGIVSVNKKIYIIGGFYSDSMFDRASSTIECYDIEKNEWSNLDRYPQNTWECTCVSLYIPKFRDDMEMLIDDNANEVESTSS